MKRNKPFQLKNRSTESSRSLGHPSLSQNEEVRNVLRKLFARTDRKEKEVSNNAGKPSKCNITFHYLFKY